MTHHNSAYKVADMTATKTSKTNNKSFAATVYDHLKANPGTCFTPAEVASAIGSTSTKVGAALAASATKRNLHRVQSGVYIYDENMPKTWVASRLGRPRLTMSRRPVVIPDEARFPVVHPVFEDGAISTTKVLLEDIDGQHWLATRI